MNSVQIENRKIGNKNPVFMIAEMSGNHNHKLDNAIKILEEAKKSGADAVKFQTYTPDTITINCENDYFRINKGTLWDGKNLYQLYKEAYTPWEWFPELFAAAKGLGLISFSTPFDKSAVDFLEKLDVPAYKIASFELVDLPLIEYVAKTGKPIIMSTGMATLSEIEEAVCTARNAGAKDLVLLKCNSSYPAPPEEMNLETIPHLKKAFSVPVGLSDHTMGSTIAIAATAKGASVIEKHFTLSRDLGGPDGAFSSEPQEFKEMVDSVRVVEKALGRVNYKITEKEKASKVFRRSLFVVKNIKAGERFSEENVRSIRPGDGLHTRYYEMVLNKKAQKDVEVGTPLSWEIIVDD